MTIGDSKGIYSELKDLNKKYSNLLISNVRGEGELKSIRKEFQTLNGSVKSHERRIGKIEKAIYLVLGGVGTLSILWTIITTLAK